MEISLRLGSRDILLTPFIEKAMKKVHVGEDQPMLFLVFGIPTEHPRKTSPGDQNSEKEKSTEPEKEIRNDAGM